MSLLCPKIPNELGLNTYLSILQFSIVYGTIIYIIGHYIISYLATLTLVIFSCNLVSVPASTCLVNDFFVAHIFSWMILIIP